MCGLRLRQCPDDFAGAEPDLEAARRRPAEGRIEVDGRARDPQAESRPQILERTLLRGRDTAGAQDEAAYGASSVHERKFCLISSRHAQNRVSLRPSVARGLRGPAKTRHQVSERGFALTANDDTGPHRRGERGRHSGESVGYTSADVGRGGFRQLDRARRSRRAHARHPVLHHSPGRILPNPAAARACRRGSRRARAGTGGRSQHRGRRPALHAFGAARQHRRAGLQSVSRRAIRDLEPHPHLDIGHTAHQPPHAQQAIRGGQRDGHHRRAQHRR